MAYLQVLAEREAPAEVLIQRDWAEGLPIEWDAESASTSLPSLIDPWEELEDTHFTQYWPTLSQQHGRNAPVYIYQPFQTYSLLDFKE